MAAFQFHLQSGKQKKWGGWGTTDVLIFVKNSLVKRKYEPAYCHDATASSFVTKVRDEVFAHFHTVAVKHNSSMWN
jgi:hypothetical protein